MPSLVYCSIFIERGKAMRLLSLTVSKVWKSKSKRFRCSTSVLGRSPKHVRRIVATFCTHTSHEILFSPSISSPCISSSNESSTFSLPRIINSTFRNVSKRAPCQCPQASFSVVYTSQSLGIFWYSHLPPNTLAIIASCHMSFFVCLPLVAVSMRSSSWSQNSAASFWWYTLKLRLRHLHASTNCTGSKKRLFDSLRKQNVRCSCSSTR
mmetsp:Transcript_35534/g.76633  ORF Transcript_35534/g.76633 Transcript_35534/m.76633 type:complete len:209 (-) Transcript_35534:30-656(-)